MAKEDDTQASHLKGHMGEIEYHSKYSRSDRIVIPNLGKLYHDKEDLRDLIAATGLEVSLNLDSNHRYFGPYDLDKWRMALKTLLGLFEAAS